MATKKDEIDPTLPTAIQQEVADSPFVAPVDSTASDLKDADGVSLPDSKYPTAFYRGSNIPYCNVCGEQYLTELDGTPKCAESRADCPRTNANP